MKTLGSSSYFKFSPWKYREKFTTTRSKQEPIFIGHQKQYFRVGLSLAVSFQYSISTLSSALPSSNTQVTDESEEIQINSEDQPKTVHVRFKLQKECAFGQQFLIVGDDPVIGLWDPSDGVPLNWSDGHLWTTELDIPSGKVITYKFVLKGETGTISWQPGPDRILETWDSEKTINVFEDWDNPELKNTVEEEEETLLPDLNENLNEQTEEVNNKELMNNSPNGVIIPKREEGILINGDRGTVNAGSNLLLSSEVETQVSSDKGFAVLVPGLIRMAMEEEEETLLNEGERENVASSSSTLSDDEVVEELSTVADQSKDAEYMPDSFHPKETIEGVWGEDMQWGRRTLEKFLSSFGFNISF